MTMILIYHYYLYYLSSIYKPIFLGSNLLFPAGPFKFIMDKEEIMNMVEQVSTEILSKTTGIRTNCKLDERQKKNLNELLSLQEENYNLNYKGMSINEQRKRITQFLLHFSDFW